MQKAFLARGAAEALVTTVCLLASLPALAQSPGEACSPPGSSVQYYGNGVLMCSRSGKWVTIMKATPPSEFGNNAAVLSTIQDRVGGAFRAVIQSVQQEITDLLD